MPIPKGKCKTFSGFLSCFNIQRPASALESLWHFRDLSFFESLQKRSAIICRKKSERIPCSWQSSLLLLDTRLLCFRTRVYSKYREMTKGQFRRIGILQLLARVGFKAETVKFVQMNWTRTSAFVNQIDSDDVFMWRSRNGDVTKWRWDSGSRVNSLASLFLKLRYEKV